MCCTLAWIICTRVTPFSENAARTCTRKKKGTRAFVSKSRGLSRHRQRCNAIFPIVEAQCHCAISPPRPNVCVFPLISPLVQQLFYEHTRKKQTKKLGMIVHSNQ